MNFKRFLFGAIAAVSVALVGCGGGSSSGGAQLSVFMADAPDPSITSMLVTVDEVQANVDDTWHVISTPNSQFELLDLVFDPALLGTATIPTGELSQIRLIVSSAQVTDDDGTHDVTIPSGLQTGIKLNVHETVNANDVVQILLDFNINKSLIKQGNGNYRLQPVIPTVVMVLSGSATGSVVDAGDLPLEDAIVTATYVAGTEYPIGTEVNSGTSQADGRFKVWALLPGTYDFSVEWTDPDTLTVFTGSANGVAITAGNEMDLGAIQVN